MIRLDKTDEMTLKNVQCVYVRSLRTKFIDCDIRIHKLRTNHAGSLLNTYSVPHVTESSSSSLVYLTATRFLCLTGLPISKTFSLSPEEMADGVQTSQHLSEPTR